MNFVSALRSRQATVVYQLDSEPRKFSKKKSNQYDNEK